MMWIWNPMDQYPVYVAYSVVQEECRLTFNTMLCFITMWHNGNSQGLTLTKFGHSSFHLFWSSSIMFYISDKTPSAIIYASGKSCLNLCKHEEQPISIHCPYTAGLSFWNKMAAIFHSGTSVISHSILHVLLIKRIGFYYRYTDSPLLVCLLLYFIIIRGSFTDL